MGTETEDGKEDRDQQDVGSVDFAMDGKKIDWYIIIWEEETLCMLKAGGIRRTARKGRARLLAKFYEVRAFTCQKSQTEISMIAVIMDPEEINKILQHLVKAGRYPPGINTASLN